MNNHDDLVSKLSGAFNDVLSKAIEFVPNLLAAMLILVVGWLVARLIRGLVIRLISQLDVLWQKMVANKGLVALQPRNPPTRFIGEVLFWLTLLVAVILATEILGLRMFVSWLNEIIRYLPLLVSGLLIILAGFIVSSLMRDLVTSAMTSSGLSQGDAVGRLVQVIILFTAIVIGADQVGINVSFLSIISAIILGVTLGSVALAFGLGARAYVSNLIAAHYLHKDIKPGDRIKIGEISGAVMEISNSRLVLETEAGRVSFPASIIDQQNYLIERGQ